MTTAIAVMKTFALKSGRTFSAGILAVSFLVVSGRNASDPYCPASQFGYFADPTNCSRYALCYNGRLTGILQCPPDLHWHVTENGYGFCDLPSSAECQLTSVPDPTGPREPRFMCPRTLLCDRQSVDGQYGDPFNCSRFYLCIDGQSYASDCPAGMSWSERAGHCDWSRRANCDLRLLQRYGLECVNDTVSEELTTDATQPNGTSQSITATDCSATTIDCRTTNSDLTISDKFTAAFTTTSISRASSVASALRVVTFLLAVAVVNSIFVQ